MDAQTIKIKNIEGSFFPKATIIDSTNNELPMSSFYGNICIFIYFLGGSSDKCIKLLKELNERYDLLKVMGVRVCAVCPQPSKELQTLQLKHNLKFKLYSDPKFELGKKIVAAHDIDIKGEEAINVLRTIIIFDGFTRIRKTYQGEESSKDITSIINNLFSIFPMLYSSNIQPANVPVLNVPKVIPKKICKEIIDCFKDEIQSDEQLEKFKKHLKLFDYKIKTYIAPQLKKAFGFECTRREEPYILKSTNENSNVQRIANLDSYSYRRFSVVIFLNAEEFSGGAIQFPEFGLESFKPTSGDALIYSAGCLEKTRTIYAGNRWILGTYLYNEEDAKLRRDLAGDNQKTSIKKPEDDQIPDPVF